MNIPPTSSSIRRPISASYAVPITRQYTDLPRFNHRSVSKISNVNALKYASGAIVCGALLGVALGAAEVVTVGGRNFAGTGAAAGAAAGVTMFAVTIAELGLVAGARNVSAKISKFLATDSSNRNNTSALSGRVSTPTAPPEAQQQSGTTCKYFENYRVIRAYAAKLGYTALVALAGAAAGAAVIGSGSVAATIAITRESDTVINAAKMGCTIGGIFGAVAGSVMGVFMFDHKYGHSKTQTGPNMVSIAYTKHNSSVRFYEERIPITASCTN